MPDQPAEMTAQTKMVPYEPTEEMRLAGSVAIQEHYRGDGGWCGLLAAQEQMILTWNAMLLAAPACAAPMAILSIGKYRIDVNAIIGDALKALPFGDHMLFAAPPDFQAHTKAVSKFMNELYAIMVDPCAEGEITVAEMRDSLIKAALRDRERANAPQDFQAGLEAAAKVCEAQAIHWDNFLQPPTGVTPANKPIWLRECARQIRALAAHKEG